jgi:Xaa-Pro aminopeptidase
MAGKQGHNFLKEQHVAKRTKTTKYQSFEEVSDPSNVAPRVAALRDEMAADGLDAFLIPRADAHRGESLPDSEQRLAHITGFTGSAGMAIIAKEKAALFVDGRYTLQAPAQTDPAVIEVKQTPAAKLVDWILENLPRGVRIGFDPWLHTLGEIRDLKNKLGASAILVASKNLVERIWKDRPAPPMKKVELLGTNRTGISRKEKIKSVQQALSAAKADATVLTLPESINWLFNIRGRDVPNTPVVLSFAIVRKDAKPALFVDPEKLGKNQRDQLTENVDIFSPANFEQALKDLGKDKKSIWIDPATCPDAVSALLSKSGASLIEKSDPVLLPKAKKNPAELAGMREAHRLDAIAMVKFLRWFDENAPEGGFSEIDIATALEGFRTEEKSLIDISFDTISGAGPNGAIVHYRVTNATNRTLVPGELMLVDSGGQYLSGTTDITRTLFTGAATEQQKRHFTLVLKGMIAISTLNFPIKTSGSQIDILARHALWQQGLNYNHGTGHGVGAFLSVHEGPAGIAPRYHVALEQGMILSNEPGFYLEGEYGIRIENLVHVVKSHVATDFLAFETLTLVPIETRLIAKEMLTDHERDWLNAYHGRVLAEIGPSVQAQDRAWLEQATAKI